MVTAQTVEAGNIRAKKAKEARNPFQNKGFLYF